MAAIDAIYRYPVKGLSPEQLSRTRLSVGATLPGDRHFAIENGPSGFDPAAPRYQPKSRYLMLMRDERLATLRTRFDERTGMLVIEQQGRPVAHGNLGTEAGRASIEHFFADFCAEDLRGPPRLLHAPGHSFSDVASKVVSIINLASLDALAKVLGAPVDPLRFRANLYVADWPAWHEFDLIGRHIAAGPQAQLKVLKRIVRCAAVNVDPQTGIRDLTIPDILMRTYGHADCGVYAEVVRSGEIATGDALREV